MKEKLKRMTAYHADDYDMAESDLHSELVLATTKVSMLISGFLSLYSYRRLILGLAVLERYYLVCLQIRKQVHAFPFSNLHCQLHVFSAHSNHMQFLNEMLRRGCNHAHAEPVRLGADHVMGDVHPDWHCDWLPGHWLQPVHCRIDQVCVLVWGCMDCACIWVWVWVCMDIGVCGGVHGYRCRCGRCAI